MLDFVPSIRKLPNTRYCCRNLEFFPNPNISNIRQLFFFRKYCQKHFRSDSSNNTRPIYTPHHMSDVQYSWFLCCTKFLFPVWYKIPFFQWCTIFLISMMYNTPVFCDVQYSWFQWCTIFLYSAMYNIPVFHVVQ